MVTKRELRERYREEGIMFKKSHTVAEHLSILEPYNLPDISFLQKQIFKCVPLTISFLLLNKKIKNIVLQYYTGCLAFLYFYIAKPTRSIHDKNDDYKSKCWFSFRHLIHKPGCLDDENCRCHEDQNRYPLEISLDRIPVYPKYISSDIVYEGMAANADLKDAMFDIFFQSFNSDFPINLIGNVIGVLTERSAMKYISHFFGNSWDFDCEVIMDFIKCFPKLINYNFGGYFPQRLVDILVGSYLSYDYDEDFSDELNFIVSLIGMGMDMSLVSSVSIDMNDGKIFCKIRDLLELGIYKSKPFLTGALNTLFGSIKIKADNNIGERESYVKSKLRIRFYYDNGEPAVQKLEEIRLRRDTQISRNNLAASKAYCMIYQILDLNPNINFLKRVSKHRPPLMNILWNIDHEALC